MSLAVALQFLEGFPHRVLRVMQALSAAESLTDNVARQVLEVRGVSGARADMFLDLLHCSNYVVPRNSEWHFSPDVRMALRHLARQDNVPLEDVHSLLLRIGREGNRADAGDLIPAYLFTNAGEAYHNGELGFTDEALEQYARSADASDNGELWLAGALSQEQYREGTLGAHAIEPAFLRGLSAYRERDDDRAYPDLLAVVGSEKRSELVAWAMQLCGEIEMRRGELDAARIHLDQAVELFETLQSWDKCIWALEARSEVLRRLGLTLPALQDLWRAISMCLGDWRARLLCRAAVVEHERQHLDEALAALDEAEACADRLLGLVMIRRAALKRERGDPVGALRDLDRAVAVSELSRRSIALNTRASVHWELGRWNEARHDLDQAMRIANPENRAVILNTRSCVLRDIGDFAGSLADDQAIRDLPLKLRWKMNMDNVAARSRGVQSSLRKLRLAGSQSEVDSFWFKHFYTMAQVGIRSRAWYRVVELLKSALAHAHTVAERAKCLRGIGFAYEKTLDDKSLAIEPLLQAVDLAPHDSVSLATLGRVLDDQGQPLDRVAPYFMRAIEADPKNEWARSWYALALSRAGRHEEAIRHAESALGDPPHPVLLFNAALVLDASPESLDRQRALGYARQAAAGARPEFDEPARFLEQRLPG